MPITNALQISEELEHSGFTHAQAVVLAKVIELSAVETRADLATKTDLREMELRLDGKMKDMELRLDSKMKDMELRLDGQIQAVRTEIHKATHDQLWRFITALFVGLGMFTTATGLLFKLMLPGGPLHP